MNMEQLLHRIGLVFSILFIIKIITSFFFYRKKYNAKTTSCFWLYLFFIILTIPLNILNGIQTINFNTFNYLDPLTILYFKLIFLTSSFVVFQVFSFRTVIGFDIEDYITNPIELNKKRKQGSYHVICFSSLAVFFQVLLIGLAPQTFISINNISPDLIAVIITIICCLSSLYSYHQAKAFRVGLVLWTCYIASYIPTLLLNQSLMYIYRVSNFVSHETVYVVLIKTPLLLFQGIRYLLFGINLFNFQDFKYLYLYKRS